VHVQKFGIGIMYSEIVAEARIRQPDFLMMTSDDTSLGDPSILKRLPEYDLPVVDGIFPTWQAGHFYWNCYHLSESGMFTSVFPNMEEGLVQVYASALPFVCIKKEVYMRTDMDPLFSWALNSDGTCQPLGTPAIMFCRKLHMMDIPLMVNMDIVGEHTMPLPMIKTMDTVVLYTRKAIASSMSPDPGSRYDPVKGLPTQLSTDTYGMGLPVCDSYKKRWGKATEDTETKAADRQPPPQVQGVETEAVMSGCSVGQVA